MFSCRYFFKFFVLIKILKLVLSNNTNNLDLSRGFGDGINWVTLEEASQNEERKPYFILIHKSWCGACQRLKESLRDSLKFQELSEQFYMINLEDDEEPNDEAYSPDGNYIPRLLFFDQDANFRGEIYNEIGNPNYKYFYSNENQVIRSMEKAIETLYELDYELNVSRDEESLNEDEIIEEGLYDSEYESEDTQNSTLHDEL